MRSKHNPCSNKITTTTMTFTQCSRISQQQKPIASTLRPDQHLHRQVIARIAELHLSLTTRSEESDSGTGKSKQKRKGKKSGRAQTADDIVIREIDWPHYYVHQGTEGKPAKYEDLTACSSGVRMRIPCLRPQWKGIHINSEAHADASA